MTSLPEFLTPVPNVVCNPADSPNGSGILVRHHLCMTSGRVGCPFFAVKEVHHVFFSSRDRDYVEQLFVKKNTAGRLDVWARNEIKALSLSWFVGLASVLHQIEALGRRTQGLLDANISMLPEAEGDSTPLDLRPPCVLPVVHRIWASARLARTQDWFYPWAPDSVFNACKGVSSVDDWYSTTIDVEDVLSATRHRDFHISVADVVKSFDTVD